MCAISSLKSSRSLSHLLMSSCAIFAYGARSIDPATWICGIVANPHSPRTICSVGYKVATCQNFVQIRSQLWPSIINSSPSVGGQSNAISVSVCLSVCLYTHISQKPHVKISRKFHSVTVAQPSSDVRRCDVFWILWMMTQLIIIKGVVQNQRRRTCFVQFARWRHQSDLVSSSWWQHRGRSLPPPTATCLNMFKSRRMMEQSSKLLKVSTSLITANFGTCCICLLQVSKV